MLTPILTNKDEQSKNKTLCTLAIASLAEASNPYGYEVFEKNLIHDLKGLLFQTRGRQLAAVLKAMGFLIPLMEEDISFKYIKDIVPIVKREFKSPDDEMKKIVLKVI